MESLDQDISLLLTKKIKKNNIYIHYETKWGNDSEV